MFNLYHWDTWLGGSPPQLGSWFVTLPLLQSGMDQQLAGCLCPLLGPQPWFWHMYNLLDQRGGMGLCF